MTEETKLRVSALEGILVEKGYVDPAALDLLIETYETKAGTCVRSRKRKSGSTRIGVGASWLLGLVGVSVVGGSRRFRGG